MIALLARRNLTLKPWRTLFLLFGFSVGVSTMIVLLSVGEALLDQAKDEKLVGGGSVTVLPEGVDVEVLKTGGLGGMFFSIDQARFIYRQLLGGARVGASVSAVAPQLDGKLVYLKTVNGAEYPVRASGDLPSLNSAVGVTPNVVGGVWADDSLDRRYRAPSLTELRHEIDHFHQPTGAAAADPSWAEWHYFNIISPDRKVWAFVSFIIAGNVGSKTGQWGGQVLVTLHEQGKPARRFVSGAPGDRVAYHTDSANLRIGDSRVDVLPNGQYRVHALAAEPGSGEALRLDMDVEPAAGAYFPGAAVSSGIVSGYVVPALRASASGKLCVSAECSSFTSRQSYHDHNWGVWRGVSWEWGAARAGNFTFLYGRVEQPDSLGTPQPLFVYVVDSTGFLGVFRPKSIEYADGRTTTVDGAKIRTPSTATMVDVRGNDTLRISLRVEDASATDTRQAMIERGDTPGARKLARPFFVQMKGVATISGRIGKTPLAGSGAGFFETYR